jgi:hypothetical protein
MAKVPGIFDQPGATFVFLPSGIKFPPIEKGWEKKGHSFQEATSHAVKGGNVAILAVNGFIGFDQDVPAAFQGLALPITTTWETRPGRFGMWFTCNDRTPEVLAKYGKKPDQSQLKLFKDGKPVGEVKLERTYQVIPPSWKRLEDGRQTTYKLLDSSPPAEISLKWLLKELQKLGITFSEGKKKPDLEANAQKLQDMAREGKVRRAESEEVRIRKYAEAALQDEVQLLASTPEGSRNDQLNKSAFALGQFVAVGLLSEGEVSGALSKAATYAGLTPQEIDSTINSGLGSGASHPREIPEARAGGDPSEGMGERKEAQEISSPCGIKELIDTFKKWLYVTEDYNIVGPCVAAVANFCPGDPDIIGVIGPSGSIKTELIRSLGETQNKFVYPISSITEHTLCSGHKESRDLLPQLKGRLLTIKDLTSILSKEEKVRAQIFADFREISDGYIHKEFGNGVVKEYRDLHSSILFASTNAIERYYSMYANLGQRIIFIRPRNDSEKARERAFQNRGKQKEMRQELHTTMMGFVASIKEAIEARGLPSTSEEVQDEMGSFYDFLAIARTPIHRDYRTDEIDEIPEPEYPTRICNTISRLCEVHALIFGRDEVGEDDKAFGLRVVLDNIPTRRWQILRTMPSGWVITSQIATSADMSTEAAKRVLDELISLKIIQRWARENKTDGMDKRSDSYKISGKWLEIIEELRGVISGDSTIDSEIETERDSSIKEENTVNRNSPPQSLIIIPGGEEEKTGMGPNPRRDMPTPGQQKDEFRALLQFQTDYRTEWPRGGGKYETVSYMAGDECVAPLERAIRWQTRGVAKIRDVDLLLEAPA